MATYVCYILKIWFGGKKGFISAAGKAEEKTLELKKVLFVRKKFKLTEHSLPRIVIDPTNEIQVSSENDFFSRSN